MNNVHELKEIAKYLLKITPKKAFAIEIMSAVESEEEIIGLKTFLINGSELVQTEVYDYVSKLTKGRFVKEFVKSRYLKQEYLMSPSADRMQQLVEQLEEDGVWVLMNWNLTKDEKRRFEESSIGDIINIDTSAEPVLFSKKDNDTVIIPIYSSEEEIQRVRYDEYMVQKTSFAYVKELTKAVCGTIKKDTVLALDIDSDDYIEISQDMINEKGEGNIVVLK